MKRQIRQSESGSWCVIESEWYYPFAVLADAERAAENPIPMTERRYSGFPMIMFREKRAA